MTHFVKPSRPSLCTAWQFGLWLYPHFSDGSWAHCSRWCLAWGWAGRRDSKQIGYFSKLKKFWCFLIGSSAKCFCRLLVMFLFPKCVLAEVCIVFPVGIFLAHHQSLPLCPSSWSLQRWKSSQGSCQGMQSEGSVDVGLRKFLTTWLWSHSLEAIGASSLQTSAALPSN